MAACNCCEGGHRDEVLAARCQLLQGIQRREGGAGETGAGGAQVASSSKSNKKRIRKKRIMCQSLENNTNIEGFCPPNTGPQKDEQQEHNHALLKSVNGCFGKGCTNKFAQVLSILSNMKKGAWIKWVEKQYNKKFGGHLQKDWLMQMEEKGLVRREEPGVIFSLMTEDDNFLDAKEMECEDLFFSCDSDISQEDEKKARGSRRKPGWLTLLMDQELQ